MTSERTLKKWRKDALGLQTENISVAGIKREYTLAELNKRILRMTQELLDQYLISK